MSNPGDSLLSRVQGALQWPHWSAWTDHAMIEAPVVATHATDHESRAFAVGRRLELAKTVEHGGPYIEVFREQAHERILHEVGTDLGPLAAFTFAIKDLVAVQGHRATAGSAVRADAPMEMATAPIVSMLEAQGAVAVGIVTLHEFAFGVTGINEFAGTAVNPKAPDRLPGGSSSGSASAVADGSARIAIGTDTGGSVRIPAAFCGIVGFKPSHGTYPAAGVFPLSGTLDHVGFFANNVADVVSTHRALGHSVQETRLPQRVGVARSDIDAADPDVQALMTSAIDALAEAGCEVVDVSWPDAEKTFVTSTAIMFSEAAAFHAESLAVNAARYGHDIKTRLDIGARLTGIDVATAHEYRRQLIADVSATLNDVDVIIGPTTPMAAPLVTEAEDKTLAPRIVANTRLGNVVGLPVISLPLPTTGPPVGLQMLGLHDDALLSYAAAIEATLPEPTPE